MFCAYTSGCVFLLCGGQYLFSRSPKGNQTSDAHRQSLIKGFCTIITVIVTHTEGFAPRNMSDNRIIRIVWKYLRIVSKLQPDSLCSFLAWIVYLLCHTRALIRCWITSQSSLFGWRWRDNVWNTPNTKARPTKPNGPSAWCIPVLTLHWLP